MLAPPTDGLAAFRHACHMIAAIAEERAIEMVVRRTDDCWVIDARSRRREERWILFALSLYEVAIELAAQVGFDIG